MSVDAKILWDTNEREMKKLADLVRKFGKEVDLSDKQVKELEDSLDKMGKSGQENTKKVQKEMDNLNSIGKKVGGTIIALFAVDRLIDYQKQIIKISAEYQRMEAVLTTALGSRSSAQIAMAQIQNFAKNTPFQVNQLTDSYTKLVNRGIVPANKQLTAMGDFSAAAGKDMEQLVEAILDVNNTERWTELGLKVKTEGDTIKGTFKGMTVEAERTEEGALKMVEAFGEMEGVAGAMEGISKTTGGAISNLDDAIDQLLNTIGQAESGVIADFTRGLSNMITTITQLIETDLQKSNQLAAEIFDNMREKFGDVETEEQYVKAIEEMKAANHEVRKSFNETQAELTAYQNKLDNAEGKVFDFNGTVDDSKRAISILKKELVDINGEMLGNERTIEFLEKAMKKLGDQTNKTTLEWKDFIISTSDQAVIDKMRETREEMERLQKDLDGLGGGSEFQFDDEIEEMMDDAIDTMDQRGDEFVQANERVVERTKREWDALKDHRREVVDGLIDLTTTLTNSLFEINQADRERELEALQEDTEQKLALAGENENRKAEILKESEQKREAIETEQRKKEKRNFLFDQALSLAEVFIQTRLAVAQAIAISPITFGEPFASYARIQGAISAGIIAAQTLPAFADGIERVSGPGTETSDSIHAKLSKNERVIKAAHNKEIGYDMSNEQLVAAAKFYRALPGEVRSDLIGLLKSDRGIDNKILASEISKPIVKQLKNQPGVSINIDSHGADLAVTKGQERFHYIAKQFGVRIN